MKKQKSNPNPFFDYLWPNHTKKKSFIHVESNCLVWKFFLLLCLVIMLKFWLKGQDTTCHLQVLTEKKVIWIILQTMNSNSNSNIYDHEYDSRIQKKLDTVELLRQNLTIEHIEVPGVVVIGAQSAGLIFNIFIWNLIFIYLYSSHLSLFLFFSIYCYYIVIILLLLHPNINKGKSSLLESLSGIQLPRGESITTRVPLFLRLERAKVETPYAKIGTILD